jgi:hypothetical protein
VIPAAHAGTPGTVDYTVAANRSTDPIVLTGKDLMAGTSTWSVPENATFAVPEKDATCFINDRAISCPEQYNHYVDPDVDTSGAQSQLPIQGTPTNQILGYRYDAATKSYVQIPFQVDEVFTRYLNNDASGFGIYSGTDQHTTYAYPREGFRFTENGGKDGCTATMKSGDAAAQDPVKGMDTNDEMAFMASDAGPQAPAATPLPAGVDGVKTVTILDPTNPNASNGYVHYQRDDNADTLAFSRSSYGDYGPAKQGPYCTPDGKPVLNADGTPKIGPRRELDGATIYTNRYKFRYDGRWLMTGIQVSNDSRSIWRPGQLGELNPAKTYGPDLVDRWKARAFAQDPGSNTPCCGYEEEDTNWGGSSSLLGELSGPVRTIRETWGSDSGTNVIRRETFYRDRMVQKTWLRVHVIPPVDGIYAQWDFNAGRMTKFYNANNPGGVAVDGKNDEVYGNFDDPCNDRWDNSSHSAIDAAFRSTWQNGGICGLQEKPQQLWDQLLGPVAQQDPTGQLGSTRPDYYHQSIDPGDATFDDANASLGWSETGGPWGTIVDRIHAEPTDLTPGGAAQSIAAVPYYRDDSCFDDGTGSDPGPVINLRSSTEATTYNGKPRKCWTPADGPTNAAGGDKGDAQFYQGDIGTHGLHLLFQLDSDNARLTEPVDQIVSDWDLVMLPPTLTNGVPTNVGEQYGRPLEKPLVTVVTDQGVAPPAAALRTGHGVSLGH